MGKLLMIGRWVKGKCSVVVDLKTYREMKGLRQGKSSNLEGLLNQPNQNNQNNQKNQMNQNNQNNQNKEEKHGKVSKSPEEKEQA